MAALPYMPLYVADYLADAAHLSTLEHGAYLILIMTYWQRGEALPDDDRKLARIARLSDGEWAAMRDDIAEFFQIGDGVWRHKRVERELNGVREKSDQAKRAGEASARARSKPNPPPSPTDGKRPLNGRSTPAERTVNHTDTDIDTELPPQPPCGGSGEGSRFDEFVSAYPAHTEDRIEPARVLFDNLSADDQQLAIEGARRYAAGRGERKVVSPTRWLREKGWITAGQATASSVVTPSPTRVFVEKDSQQWDAWNAHHKATTSRPINAMDFVVSGRHRDGLYFPSEWPPGHDPPLGHPDLAASDDAAA